MSLRDHRVTTTLFELAKEARSFSIRDLYANDPQRATRFRLCAPGYTYFYATQLINQEILSYLFDLARACGVEEMRGELFSGRHVNSTEDRPALHSALRLPPTATLEVGGVTVVEEVHEVLDKMAGLAKQVRSGKWRGYSGKKIRAVVNIGIGGSDLGPAMAAIALKAFSTPTLSTHYVSNVDPTDMATTLRTLDPERTLFIVASKTFTTIETLTNAEIARSWLLRSAKDKKAVSRHFVAVSSAPEKVEAFGIDPQNRFDMWDWVGGRYSMDSAIGLSTMIAIGPKAFNELLRGFYAMDQHFQNTPMEENLCMVMGLLGVWNATFLGADCVGVLPYAQALSRFPAYLQQLTMESNGKRVSKDGRVVDYQTGPVYFGEPGTNGQHSFYQLLHQGTRFVPLDLIGYAKNAHPIGESNDLLIANLIAQSHAFAFGRTRDEAALEGGGSSLALHREMPGNRPHSVFFAEALTPSSLGSLIAAYEHSVFVQGVIWNINSFDQFGVEMGKKVAAIIAPQLSAPLAHDVNHDPSSDALIALARKWRDENR